MIMEMIKMNEKVKIASILLFIFSFWFQPSSPFLVKWLTQSKDFTAKQVYEDLFPLWSYAQFFLVIGGLFAQYVSFKAVFVFGAILSFASNILLMWGDSMGWMRASELTNGAAVGTFGIFSAYIYTVFPQSFHQTITSYTRATTLIATTASASAGQLTVSLTSTVLVALCISLGVGVCNCLISFFLPRPIPPQSVQLQQTDTSSSITKCDTIQGPAYVVVNSSECAVTEEKSESNAEVKPATQVPSGPLTLRDQWRIMLANYNVPVLIWSTWSGLCIAIHMLVLTYWQSVMNEIDPSVNYNGYVSTVAYAFAAAMTLIPTRIEPLLNRNADYLLVVMPVLYGLCLILLSRETVIYLAYMWLILYHALFEFTLAISSVQIARRTGKSKQFGVVFSFNMLIALLFQNLLQLLVGKQVLNLTPTQQYYAYGFTFLGISVLCLLWQLALKIGARGKAGLEKRPLIV